METSEEKIRDEECVLQETDDHQESDLCCCYVIGSDNEYSDPCVQPVDCCC